MILSVICSVLETLKSIQGRGSVQMCYIKLINHINFATTFQHNSYNQIKNNSPALQ